MSATDDRIFALVKQCDHWHRAFLDSLDERDRLREERDAARWYGDLLKGENVLVQRDAALARLREVEEMVDDPDAYGHGLFCGSHYRRPCNCWAAKLATILGGAS